MAIIEDEEYRSRGPVENAIEDWSVCVHEAGHAVVAERNNVRVDSATVVPGRDYLGIVDFERSGRARQLELLGNHIINVAGCTAESFVQDVKKSRIWRERRFYHWESGDFKSVVRSVRDERGERQYKEPCGGRGRWQPCCALPVVPRTSKADREVAWEVWKRTAAWLRNQFRKDPSHLRQIFAVARELSLRRELSGDEVREAMAAAR